MAREFKRFMARYVLFVFGVGVGCAVVAQAADFVPGGQCTRGRVQNNGTTIVSDWGTPLRGGCWCGDCHSGNPTREEIHAIKSCGLNSFHDYVEKNDDKPVGFEAANTDTLVEWCRQESLYLVITFGHSALPSYGKVDEFWRFYAPRYADQAHVVYEAKNEGEDVVENSKNWYRIIREGAPDTHILFGSYSNLMQGSQYALRDINGIGDGVDWSNASIAFHGYGMTGGTQEQIVHELNAAGYATTVTEFPNGADAVRAYENAGISYFHFAACWGGMFGQLCGHVRGYGISWEPDFGDWPQPHVDRPEPVESLLRTTAPAEIGVGAYTLAINGNVRGAAHAVYDLTGRLLRHNPVGGGIGADSRVDVRGTTAGSQVLIVK